MAISSRFKELAKSNPGKAAVILMKFYDIGVDPKSIKKRAETCIGKKELGKIGEEVKLFGLDPADYA